MGAKRGWKSLSLSLCPPWMSPRISSHHCALQKKAAFEGCHAPHHGPQVGRAAHDELDTSRGRGTARPRGCVDVAENEVILFLELPVTVVFAIL